MDSRKVNEDRKSKREAKHYWNSRVRYEGQVYHILLTDVEVRRGIERANKNPEDVPGFWKRLRLVFGV
jgi:hypothetical protein